MRCAKRFWLSLRPSIWSASDLRVGVGLAVELLVDAVLRERDVELHDEGVAVLAQHVPRRVGRHDGRRAHEVVAVARAQRHAALEVDAVVDDDGRGRHRRRPVGAEVLGRGDEPLQVHGVSQLLLLSGRAPC